MLAFGAMPHLPTRDAALALAHRTAPKPLHFPEEAEMPETMVHLLLRTLLFQMLQRRLGRSAAVGSEQFVYFNARDPRKCLAPDAFVKLGAVPEHFPIWKTWERGVPELCVEIASPFDKTARGTKLARYHELGVCELAMFDPNRAAGKRFRVWDRIDDALVERKIVGESTPCLTLGMHWVVRPADGVDAALRLAEDPAGDVLVPTSLEIEDAYAKQTAAREAAEKRIAELEEALRLNAR